MFHKNGPVETNCYRDIIREELEKRIKANSSYSLRSFAKKLEMPPSRLSEILNHKQGISPKWAVKISQKLNFDKKKAKHFKLLVDYSQARSAVKKDLAGAALTKLQMDQVREVPLDHYALISDFHHYALMELMKTENFKHSEAWMAEKLGISKAEVKDAIDRLKRLGVVRYLKGKYIVADGNPLSTISTIPSEAIRQHHLQVLEKAKRSVTEQTIEQRELNTLIFAVSEADLPEIRAKIREFFNDLNTTYSAPERKNDKVYAFSAQLFDLLNTDIKH